MNTDTFRDNMISGIVLKLSAKKKKAGGVVTD